jgi:FkbM family methyltransferase
MSDLLRPLKELRYRIFYAALLRRGYTLTELGNAATGCQWIFCPTHLNAESIIYSGGVGRDITFEHGLVKNYGSRIVLFDPSPTGLETMALPENKIPAFTHHPVALADHCGELRFAPPKEDHEGSWFTADAQTATISVPCVDLATLMARHGHTHIDLLKVDIEGAEYRVLDNLLRRKLRVRQVLVEFHHQMLPGVRRSQSVRAILKMVAAGYKLLDQSGGNHTFLRTDW